MNILHFPDAIMTSGLDGGQYPMGGVDGSHPGPSPPHPQAGTFPRRGKTQCESSPTYSLLSTLSPSSVSSPTSSRSNRSSISSILSCEGAEPNHQSYRKRVNSESLSASYHEGQNKGQNKGLLQHGGQQPPSRMLLNHPASSKNVILKDSSNSSTTTSSSLDCSKNGSLGVSGSLTVSGSASAASKMASSSLSKSSTVPNNSLAVAKWPPGTSEKSGSVASPASNGLDPDLQNLSLVASGF